jgi:hypothetical protein
MVERRRKLNLGNREVEVADVEILSRKRESVAEYELEDGSIIRVSTPIASVLRMEEFDVNGDPIYLAIPSTAVTLVQAPDSLKKRQ